jgi:methionine synthase II (cobalamin-independent)
MYIACFDKTYGLLMEITKEITIEDLVGQKVAAVRYLADKGIKCIACGEPIWGTLEEAAKEKGFGEREIEDFVRELKEL